MNPNEATPGLVPGKEHQNDYHERDPGNKPDSSDRSETVRFVRRLGRTHRLTARENIEQSLLDVFALKFKAELASPGRNESLACQERLRELTENKS